MVSLSVNIKLPHSNLSVFNIYRPPSSSAYSKPSSVFLDEFSSFLSPAATTPHQFLITGDFNIPLDNASDNLTSKVLTLHSSFQLISTC